MRETLNQKASRLSKLRAQGALSFLQELRLIWIQAPDGLKSFIVRSVFGFSLMWFVTHAAVYHYALKYGMQLPLEGVPFLIVVSIIASTAISFFSAINIAFQSRADELLLKRPDIDNIPQAPWEKRYGEKGSFVYAASQWFGRLLLIFVAIFVLLQLVAFFYLIIYKPETRLMAFLIITTAVLFFVVILYFGKHAEKVKYKTAGNIFYILGLLFVSVFIMFLGGIERILQVTKFGGGIEIELRSEQALFSNASLMLQTNSTVVIWDRTSGDFIWVPLSEVERMEFNSDPKILLPMPRPVSYRVGVRTG